MDLMTSITCLFVKLKYAIKNQLKVKLKDGVQEILLRLLPIYLTIFTVKKVVLSVLDRKEERLMGLLLLLVRKERGLLLGTAGSLLTCNLVWISVHPTLHLAKTTSSSPLLLAVSFIPIRRAVHPFSRNVQQSRGCLFTKNLVISSLRTVSGRLLCGYFIDYFQLQPTKSYPLTQTTTVTID